MNRPRSQTQVRRRPSRSMWLAGFALLAITLFSVSAFAQNQPLNLEPLPEPPPIPAGADTPGDNPPAPGVPLRSEENTSVRVIENGDDRIEEHRYRGRLYMVKVTPRVGPSYYMVDAKGDGNMVRKDSIDPDKHFVQWKLLSW